MACRALMKDSMDSVLNYHPLKTAWQAIRNGIGKDQKFNDSEEWREIEEFCGKFDFKISHRDSQTKIKQIKVPNDILNPYRVVAVDLGVSLSTLIQIGIMESLQYQEGIMEVEMLKDNVNRFFARLRRRLRRLASMFGEFEIDLTEEMQNAVNHALDVSRKGRA